MNFSKETNQDPVNAASFGKLIRSVFLGLRTRRIGTRGNSKYHYYGIRVKPTSSLNQFDNEGSPSQGISIDIRLIWHLPIKIYIQEMFHFKTFNIRNAFVPGMQHGPGSIDSFSPKKHGSSHGHTNKHSQVR